MASLYNGRITTEGLVLNLDAANIKCSANQRTNILIDPHEWVEGTGGSTGYGANGGAAEQSRVRISDDPWGNYAVTWRTTPDATSGADGGWNTSSYSIDNTFTYRWSVWVRRYTSGTGGRFYMGLNPAPIRNDTGASQSNPYFTYPSQGSLTEGQWYLVVGHCFPVGYTGGRHPDSGWYENGVKISDKSYGNCGTEDVRWASSTTSALHRTYHYYTTNTASGLEFAFPRLDKCDGTEPSVKQLLTNAESNWKDPITGREARILKARFSKSKGAYQFNGSTDYADIASPLPSRYNWSVEFVAKQNALVNAQVVICPSNAGIDQSIRYNSSGQVYIVLCRIADNNAFSVTCPTADAAGEWGHYVITRTPSEVRIYRNGKLEVASTQTGISAEFAGTWSIGQRGNSTGYFNGDIAVIRAYRKVLNDNEVQANFNAVRGRYGL